MQPIAFCSRCRGMRVGWNGRYIVHCLLCKEWMSKSSKLLILTVLLSVLVLGFPTPSAFVFSGLDPVQTVRRGRHCRCRRHYPRVKRDPAVTSRRVLFKGV